MMKKKFIPLLLASLMLLCACHGEETAGPTVPTNDTSQSEQGQTSQEEGGGQTDNTQVQLEPETTAPASTQAPEIADGRLLVAQTGRYSGLNPENGSDQQSENVAAILVVNTSNQVCQFCTLEYTVDGENALFNLSELMPGKAAWVLESTGMTAEEKAQFTFASDTSIFRNEDAAWLTGVSASGDGGRITVKNDSQTDYPYVTVYYKLTYGENTYLGGIAYRVIVQNLGAGESQTLPAGHFYEGACEVVGIYADGVES